MTGTPFDHPDTPSSNKRRPSVASTAPLVHSWSVDMSAGDGAISDKNNNVNIQKQHGRGQALTTPPIDDKIPGNSKEGLNPWTIAKLVAPRRQTQQSQRSPTRNIGHVTPEEAPPFKEPPMEVSQRHGSIHRPLRGTQPATKDNSATTRIPSYSPLLNAEPPYSLSANQHNSRPGIPLEQFLYTSRGHGGRPLGIRPHPTHAGQGTGMVQSKISFGGTRSKRPRKPQTNGNHELEPLGNLGSDAYDGFARHNVPLVGLADQHTARRANNDGRRKSTAQTRADSLAGMPDNGVAVNRRIVDDLSIIRDSQESPEASLPKNDPRNYLMRRQRSLADNPQRRKIQRLKTNLLPLETTPLGFETHKLALSVHIDSQTLARSMAKISLLDSYLVEGALEDHFENGISQEVPYWKPESSFFSHRSTTIGDSVLSADQGSSDIEHSLRLANNC